MNILIIIVLIAIILHLLVGVLAGFLFILGSRADEDSEVPSWAQKVLSFAFCVVAWPWVIVGEGPVEFREEDW